MTILLTTDQESSMKATHSYIQTNDGNYYHQPFYMKDCGNGKYESVSFEHLPESVKDIILANRGIKL